MYGTIYYCFHELCHGKTELDGWFGRMKMMLETIRLHKEIKSAEDIVSDLQTVCNENYNNDSQSHEFVLFVNYF
jgi:hypothetical protein